MISVQMTLTICKVPSKLFQHFLCGNVAEFEPSAINYDLWFPTAIHALPTVALETENPQPTVVRIVFTAWATTFVMFTLPRSKVLFAGATGG
jgi:hypothetical protein